MGSSFQTFFSGGICRGGRGKRRRGCDDARRGQGSSSWLFDASSLLGSVGQARRGSTLEGAGSRRGPGSQGSSGCESDMWMGKPGWGMLFVESRSAFYTFDGVLTVVLF